MNCEQYLKLIPAEQAEFLGKLVIAVQQDSFCFIDAQRIIHRAKIAGVYETTTLHADAAALKDIDTPIENGPGE